MSGLSRDAKHRYRCDARTSEHSSRDFQRLQPRLRKLQQGRVEDFFNQLPDNPESIIIQAPVGPMLSPVPAPSVVSPQPSADRWFLMHSLQGSYPGWLLDSEHAQVYGWVQQGFAANPSGAPLVFSCSRCDNSRNGHSRLLAAPNPRNNSGTNGRQTEPKTAQLCLTPPKA